MNLRQFQEEAGRILCAHLPAPWAQTPQQGSTEEPGAFWLHLWQGNVCVLQSYWFYRSFHSRQTNYQPICRYVSSTWRSCVCLARPSCWRTRRWSCRRTTTGRGHWSATRRVAASSGWSATRQPSPALDIPYFCNSHTLQHANGPPSPYNAAIPIPAVQWNVISCCT
mgnify:CR=1 FL=1